MITNLSFYAARQNHVRAADSGRFQMDTGGGFQNIGPVFDFTDQTAETWALEQTGAIDVELAKDETVKFRFIALCSSGEAYTRNLLIDDLTIWGNAAAPAGTVVFIR